MFNEHWLNRNEQYEFTSWDLLVNTKLVMERKNFKGNNFAILKLKFLHGNCVDLHKSTIIAEL